MNKKPPVWGIHEIHQELRQVTAQRDALLEACKRAEIDYSQLSRNWGSLPESLSGDWRAILAQLRAAIAAVEGE